MIDINFKEILDSVREKNPLVHHITNYVTVNDCANTVLAIGASPVMADGIDEVEDMVSISSALVINLGTLNSDTISSMVKAGNRANKIGIPVILDPVGVGATSLRRKVSSKLLEEVHFEFIRGNSSEIKCLFGYDGSTRGVDSVEEGPGKNLEDIAYRMSRKYKTTIGITGKKDIISNGKSVYRLSNGCEYLKKITGSGCMTTSIIGSLIGVGSSPIKAGIVGISLMSISGELAYEGMNNKVKMGSYRTNVMDYISSIGADILDRRISIEKVDIYE